MPQTWIEAALNGPWSRKRQPGIPDTVEAIVAEGIACAKAGACIIHVHAYDGGGPQTFDWRIYARIIEGIRAKVDVPVYPSIPSAGIGTGPLPDDAAARFAHVEALAARGLLEFAVIDPGSVNFTELDAGPDTPAALTYLNPEAHVRHALAFAVRYGFHPAYAIYEPGFTRAGAALARALRTKTPIYRLMFSRDLRLWLPAEALRARGAPHAAGRRGARRAVDDRRPRRRHPPADRRSRAPRRACAGRAWRTRPSAPPPPTSPWSRRR